jgi:hypothetical protein
MTGTSQEKSGPPTDWNWFTGVTLALPPAACRIAFCWQLGNHLLNNKL